jgi:hypothetical protein
MDFDQQADRLQPADLRMRLAGPTARIKNPPHHHKDSQCMFFDAFISQEWSTGNPIRRFWRTWNIHARIRQVLYFMIECLHGAILQGLQIIFYNTQYYFLAIDFSFTIACLT